MNQNWRYIFPKKLEHFKALIVNNKSKLQQQNENKLMCINNTVCKTNPQHVKYRYRIHYTN